ncbi:MAG: GDSL-type esterase/lipase family protein [Cyanobacteria bacterium J06598_4]
MLDRIATFKEKDVSKAKLVNTCYLSDSYEVNCYRELIQPLKAIGRYDLVEGIEQIIDRYKEATLQACQQRDIPYLDIFDLWLSRGTDWINSHLGDDGLHPNVSGYQALFADIMAWNSID